MVTLGNGTAMPEDGAALYCANHPDRETMLRCNRCEKPICYQCAVRTPVGYRCRECVREQQTVYYNAEPYDLVIGAAIALALGGAFGFLGYAFLGLLGLFGFLAALFVGPAAGGAVAEAIRRAVKRRRARGMRWVAAGSLVLGILAAGLVLHGGPMLLSMPLGSALAVIPRLLFRLDVLLAAALAASTVYAQLH